MKTSQYQFEWDGGFLWKESSNKHLENEVGVLGFFELSKFGWPQNATVAALL
jgi:hypothetical protein